jgi:hypothetical protein
VRLAVGKVHCSQLLHSHSKAARRQLLHLGLQQCLQLLNVGTATQQLRHLFYLAPHVDWALQHVLPRRCMAAQQPRWYSCWMTAGRLLLLLLLVVKLLHLAMKQLLMRKLVLLELLTADMLLVLLTVAILGSCCC